jgi:hypothetical protein
LETGKIGFAVVGGQFPIPTPRTDSRTARAKNAFHFLMAKTPWTREGIRTVPYLPAMLIRSQQFLRLQWT